MATNHRFQFLKNFPAAVLLAGTVVPVAAPAEDSPAPRPNIVLVNLDDAGYGDFACFGATKQETPNIDRLAAEGARLTSVYGAPVCTPSRSALMTGCYPPRVGMSRIHFPGRTYGLNPEETTLPEMLKGAGYRTHMVGKWHLGDQPGAMPPDHGFDSWFGIPYSNDMWEQAGSPPLPLMRDRNAIERIATQEHQQALTRRFSEEAVRIINESDGTPFFLYLAHMAVHIPVNPGPEFHGKSDNGRYGDWAEEVDWGIGALRKALEERGLTQNTLVIVTSDNGSMRNASNTPLRGNKGTTWEGGMRVPTVVWWPGHVPADSEVKEIVSMMDFLPTLAAVTGGKVPADRVIDGRNMLPWLDGRSGETPLRAHFGYFYRGDLQAVRSGSWKLHLKSGELYNLDTDIGESTNLASAHPTEVQRLRTIAKELETDLSQNSRPGGEYGDHGPIIALDGTVREDCVGPAKKFDGPPVNQKQKQKKQKQKKQNQSD